MPYIKGLETEPAIVICNRNEYCASQYLYYTNVYYKIHISHHISHDDDGAFPKILELTYLKIIIMDRTSSASLGKVQCILIQIYRYTSMCNCVHYIYIA